LELLPNNKNIVIIDDSYNASVDGVDAAMEVLDTFKGRKIIVTPGMVELGKMENIANFEMGKTLAAQGTKILAVVMREEDERAQHPLCKIPAVTVDSLELFARGLPEVSVIALNAYVSEALKFTAPNLYCDTACIEGFPALGPLEAKEKCGKLLFGTHAPFLCASAGVSKVAALDEKNRSAMEKTLRNIFYDLM
jgi:hypothetical protein